eukprot:758602-Hanusia_phi.AAC.1
MTELRGIERSSAMRWYQSEPKRCPPGTDDSKRPARMTSRMYEDKDGVAFGAAGERWAMNDKFEEEQRMRWLAERPNIYCCKGTAETAYLDIVESEPDVEIHPLHPHSLASPAALLLPRALQHREHPRVSFPGLSSPERT